MAGDSFSTDICIIGSGAAGLSMALDLKRNSNKRVIVLEGSLVNKPVRGALRSAELFQRETSLDSDHRFEDPNAQRLYAGQPLGDMAKYDSSFLTRSRIRVLGGTTNCWGGTTRTLQKIDFERGTVGPEWPIKREDLEEAYVYAMYLCSLSADPARPDFPTSAYDEPAWWKYKMKEDITTIPFASDDPCRDGVLTIMDRGTGAADDNGWDFQLLWGKEIQVPGSKVKIMRNANVRKLATNAGKVTHVVCSRVNESGQWVEDFAVTADVFVLAAGGIEIPRLLLLSGIPGKFLGEGFMIHPLNNWPYPGMRFTPTETIPAGVRTFHERAVEFGLGSFPTKARAVLVPTDATLTANPELGNFRGMVNFGTPGKKDSGTVNFNWEQAPDNGNTITLASTIDDLGDRQVSLNWTLNQRDKDTVNHAVELVGKTLMKRGYATDYSNTINWERLGILVGDHPMGATRMGFSANDSFVDKDCRVWSTQNLYIASSSVFPTGGWSNPTLTIIALALRLSKLLR